MSACLWLERPARWRGWAVATLLAVAFLPSMPLLGQALLAQEGGVTSFLLVNSAVVAILVAALSLAVGLPAGVLVALYEFPGRRLLLALPLLPLLVPPFLWAIGWSNLAVRLGTGTAALLSGRFGCVVVFWAAALPLVLLTAYAATAALPGSQVDAARLAGGERTVLWHVSRHAAVPSAVAAALGGALTLADPGPGFIFELPTAASEILTTFAVRHDFALAGWQWAVVMAVVLVPAALFAVLAAPRLTREMLARPARGLQRLRHRPLGVLGSGLALVLLVGTLAPVIGLTLTVPRIEDFLQAWRDVARTGGNTLLYAGGTAVVATVLGLALAVSAGRSERLRTACLALCLVLFALPPDLGALGVVQVSNKASAWTDPLLRSRLTVCAVLGLRFVPVAALLGLRAWGSMPTSWAQAAALHGVPLWRYLLRVVLPFLLPAAAVALFLIAPLALADFGTVQLLAPPGEGSLPQTIVTVMANTREARAASLCLIYVALAAGSLTAVWALTRKRAA
jgi:iron(III) transport system permease protein